MDIRIGHRGLLVRARSLLALLALQSLGFVSVSAHAATYVVSASEDEPDAAPGDGVCAYRMRPQPLQQLVAASTTLGSSC